MKTTKKKSSPKIEVFFSPKSGEDQKKGLRRNLGLYSAKIWDLFVLAKDATAPRAKLGPGASSNMTEIWFCESEN